MARSLRAAGITVSHSPAEHQKESSLGQRGCKVKGKSGKNAPGALSPTSLEHLSAVICVMTVPEV